MPLLLPPAISALKINPQNPSLGSYQPTTLRTSERDGPVAGHTGKCEPSVPFIGCPSRASRTSHHHSLVRIGFIMVFAFGSATHVPLEANEDSPFSAGGRLLPMSCQVAPSVVRITGKRPFTESLCAMPRLGVQNAKQS